VAKKDEIEAKQSEAPKDSKDSKESKEAKEPKNVEAASSGFNPTVFLAETREELGKVVWPSRQQLISESLAVILMVTLSATLIYLIDNLFRWASTQVF
jgi:preprotein translocase subunit SecE